jgi:hypothetical protein
MKLSSSPTHPCCYRPPLSHLLRQKPWRVQNDNRNPSGNCLEINSCRKEAWECASRATIREQNLMAKLHRIVPAILSPCISSKELSVGSNISCNMHRNVCDEYLLLNWHSCWAFSIVSFLVKTRCEAGSASVISYYSDGHNRVGFIHLPDKGNSVSFQNMFFFGQTMEDGKCTTYVSVNINCIFVSLI